MTEEIKKEITPLIKFALHFAKEFLTESEEFYPFAAYLDSKGELKSVGYYDGDEFPLSDSVIEGLEKSLGADFLDRKFKCFCIVFDALATEAKDSEKVNAIVIRLRHAELPETYSYFYPYRISEGKISLGKPWATFEEQGA